MYSMLAVWKVSTTRMMLGCEGGWLGNREWESQFGRDTGNGQVNTAYVVELLHQHGLLLQIRHRQPYTASSNTYIIRSR